MAEERCYISNVESGGQVECRLVRKDNRFAYYTHVWALEGTKTPFIRKCEIEIWNKYCFTTGFNAQSDFYEQEEN